MQATSLWLFSFSVPCLACSMVLVCVFSSLMRLPLPVHGARDDDVKADTNYQPHHHSESNQPRLNLWLWVRSQCSTQAFKLQCVISQLKNPIDATSGQPNMRWRKGNFPLFKSDHTHSLSQTKTLLHILGSTLNSQHIPYRFIYILRALNHFELFRLFIITCTSQIRWNGSIKAARAVRVESATKCLF